jgi:hypothetical protein
MVKFSFQMKAKARTHLRKEHGRPSLLERGLSNRAIFLCFAAAVLVFCFDPLFNSSTTPQWDAIDLHYTAQKHFSDAIHAGYLPFWTPNIYSGMPFLADPQVGAWYPINWPFFLVGITPKTLEWEIALHMWIAAVGAFLVARELLGSRSAAVCGGAFYAFSGFFAAHSSHIGMFQAAAIFPWVLWTGLRASESTRWLPAAALASGLMVLAGHFQTALYGLCGLGLLLVAHAIQHPPRRRLAGFAIAAAALGALALPAIATLPGLELTAQSVRGASDYSRNADAVLQPGALLTLISPDHYGAPEVENYHGPQDITQFYFYQGILLLPLAIAGAVLWPRRWYALALVIPALWYAFGPPGGLYSILSRLPGLRSVRSPVHDWFVVALGLALLAAGGVSAARARWRSNWIPLAVLAIAACDLWYWNMGHNGLAYARDNYQDLYGAAQQRFIRVASAVIPPGTLHRLWAPADSPAFGPLNGEIDTGIEATYGYNPLELARYSRYLEIANGNPKLLDGLAVTAKLDLTSGFFQTNPTALPRLSVPASVTPAANADDAARRLATLDPAREAVAEGLAPLPQNGPAEASIVAYGSDFYKAKCRATRPAFLRLAVPYFPGWRATVDGRAAEVVPVDLALMGVVVPAGDHEIDFHYRPNRFAAGAAVSAVTLLALSGWLLVAFRRARGGRLG